jgi:TonB family protein
LAFANGRYRSLSGVYAAARFGGVRRRSRSGCLAALALLLLPLTRADAAEPEPAAGAPPADVAAGAPDRPAAVQSSPAEAVAPAAGDSGLDSTPDGGEPEDVVTPPHAVSTEVVYPEGATGSAKVILQLVVDKTGAVAAVQVLDGVEPFAQAAADAARSWRFEPARQNGRAVAARIHFALRFTQPEPIAPPEAEGSATPAPSATVTTPAPAPAPSVEVIEVQVFGATAPGAVSLTEGDVRVMAGAMGDPFRAVASLPGVSQIVTGLPVFFVRGAPPGNLGFLIDNVRVPLLFHAFLGPAVIHPRMIERVELYAGGYPASFGRYAGGVVNADLRQPSGTFNVEWSVRWIDAGAFVEAPFAGGRGNVMLAGRYSYTALILSMLSNVKLDYWDYQALVSYDLSPRDRVSVFAFGAYDYAATPTDVEIGQVAEDGQNAVLFHRLDLRYDRRIGETTKLRAAVTLGTEGTRGGQGVVRDQLAGARLELRSQLSNAVLLRAGASASFDQYELELDPETENFLDVQTLFPARTDGVMGAYADLVVQASPGVSVTPGVRVDRYTSMGNSAVGVSPRLAASFRLNRTLTIEHALGLADQPPNFVPGVPGVAVGGLPGGLQRSLQTSAGLRAELPYGFTSTTTVFQNAFFSLTDPFGQTQDLDLDAEEAAVRSTGRAVGLELFLQRPMTRGFGASLAYTLSRSTRSYERLRTLAGYDRPHVLNLGASLDLGRHWIASARGIFYSGVPGSRTFGDRRLFDQDRARPFFRMDLRLEKRFVLGPSTWWAVVAEMMNATLSSEVLRRPCEPTCTDETVGPIVLPSLGVLGQF